MMDAMKFAIGRRDKAMEAYLAADKEAKHAQQILDIRRDVYLDLCNVVDAMNTEKTQGDESHVAESDCPTTPLREMAQDGE